MLYFITTCVQTLRNNSRLFSALAIIALTAGATASAFAYTAGWLSPDRLTPARIVTPSVNVAVIRPGIVATIPRVSASPDTSKPTALVFAYLLHRCLSRGAIR